MAAQLPSIRSAIADDRSSSREMSVHLHVKSPFIFREIRNQHGLQSGEQLGGLPPTVRFVIRQYRCIELLTHT